MTEEKGKELTIREATIFSLEESEKQFAVFKTRFTEISDLFDNGDDAEALTKIKDELLPLISSFYEFCYTLISSFDRVLPQNLNQLLIEKLKKIDSLNNTLCEETEAGNFTEVGDILRFDFYDLISEFSTIFPQLIDVFENSDNKDLDQY